MLKSTPFHTRTAPLVRAQTWRRWAGHQVASAYEPHPDREYAAIRNAAALHRRLAAPQVPDHGTATRARLLDRMVTRNVAKCAVGQVLYTPWCDARRQGDRRRHDQPAGRSDTFRLTSAEPNLRWLSMNAVGLDVSIEDVSDRTAALALQGPLSRTILQQVSPADFATAEILPARPHDDPRHSGHDLAHRLHRRPRLRALGRRRARRRRCGTR